MTRPLVIMPLKRPAAAKSRLGAWLTARERHALQRAMAADVITAVRAIRPRVELVLVAQDVREARDVAGASGTVVGAPERQGLSSDLANAVRMLACRCHAARVVVLPADIPAVATDDIDHLFGVLDATDVAVVPDRHRQGTNALAFHMSHAPAFCFGAGSFARHLTAAQATAERVRIVERETLGLDIDDMDDLRLLTLRTGATTTRRLLEETGFADRPVMPRKSA